MVEAVGEAAIFERRGGARHRHGLARIGLRHLAIEQRQHFVERAAAAVGGRHHRLGAHPVGEVLQLRHQLGRGVDIGQGVRVAVEVEHEFGVVRLAQQEQPQLLGGRARRLRVDPHGDGLADQIDVERFALAQPPGELAAHHGEEVRPLPVVVDAAADIGAAQMLVLDDIGHAERIGHRDHGKAGAQQFLLVGLAQQRQQMVQHHGAGLLVGMQRRLQIDLLRRRAWADPVECQFSAAAGRVAAQRQGLALEHHQRMNRLRLNFIGTISGR